MKQLALADCRFAQCDYQPLEILADSWVEIEFAPQLGLARRNNIFVPDFFFLEKAITFVNLSVGTDQAGEFLFDRQKVLFVHSRISIVLRRWFCQDFLIKNSGCEMLCVENSHLFLVD